MNTEPRIIFEDPNIIVLSKPAGLLSQGDDSGEPHLVDWLRQYVGRHYVGLVHRLDRNTSGVMVVAKRTKAAQRLTQALQAGKLNRDYQGWILGSLPTKRQWKHTLLKNPSTNESRVVAPGTPGGKIAILWAEPLEVSQYRGVPITRVAFTLETGRSHQIRVQCAAENTPLLGDRKYGPAEPAFSRPALHSHHVTFPHPIGGKMLEFFDPLPPDLASLSQRS